MRAGAGVVGAALTVLSITDPLAVGVHLVGARNLGLFLGAGLVSGAVYAPSLDRRCDLRGCVAGTAAFLSLLVGALPVIQNDEVWLATQIRAFVPPGTHRAAVRAYFSAGVFNYEEHAFGGRAAITTFQGLLLPRDVLEATFEFDRAGRVTSVTVDRYDPEDYSGTVTKGITLK